MVPKKAAKQLAKQATRILGRLPDDKRAELARVAKDVEQEWKGRIKKPNPARIALAKLKLARLREGISLTAVSERTGIDAATSAGWRIAFDNVRAEYAGANRRRDGVRRCGGL